MRPGSPSPRPPLSWFGRLLITAAGAAGFVGLLAASNDWPVHANLCRGAAFVWLFVFGVLRLVAEAGGRRRSPSTSYSSRTSRSS